MTNKWHKFDIKDPSTYPPCNGTYWVAFEAVTDFEKEPNPDGTLTCYVDKMTSHAYWNGDTSEGDEVGFSDCPDPEGWCGGIESKWWKEMKYPAYPEEEGGAKCGLE